MAGRAFYLTFLFISILAAWTLVSPRIVSKADGFGKNSTVRRDGAFTATRFENGTVIIDGNEEVMLQSHVRRPA